MWCRAAFTLCVSVCVVLQGSPADLQSVLAGSGVHIKSRDDVMQKVAAMARDGPEKLLVGNP